MISLKQLLCGLVMTVTVVGTNAETFVGQRSDFRDETIYFAMTTRFYDGDISNNTYCWDGKLNVNDPEWRGDFKGLIEKLDYIKALGFTAVWITPIVENASGLDYHGYHAIDFSKVDPRYESTDCKFQDLIDAAHSRGMKIILDIVLQHTGNFGEENLCPMFTKDYTQNLSNINKSLLMHPDSKLPANYFNLPSGQQHSARLALMKNTDGVNHDIHNYWHHVGQNWDWDDASRWWGQIAGDCVDLNTEHPTVYNYLIDCYSKFIEMGVDGFRIDTGGHISRLTFNKAFVPALMAAAERYKDRRGGSPFFMYTEVCARAEEVIYRGQNYNCSPCFYTWKEEKDYAWDDNPTSWDSQVIMEGQFGTHTNAQSVLAQAADYSGHANMPRSNNAWLDGNNYRTEDYSMSSGLNVIDFPMHWRFSNARNAFNVRSEDNLYNDARWNVVYVDSHDYGPNGNDRCRFSWGQQAWAENLALMFTWRGIPCIYYGSEIEFRAGKTIDKGADMALREGGRAYFGGYIEGSVDVTDFAAYTGATGNMAATLSHPLALHIQRLNQIRAAVPALRKGQYSTDGCSDSGMSFKRRYTDSTTDSYALVTISGDATFTGVLNGTYTEVITGQQVTVTDGRLTAKCSGKGNMRVYVLSTALTPAPGKIGTDGKYLYATSPVEVPQAGYDGNEEPDDTVTKRDTSGGGGVLIEPDEPVEPSMARGEQAVFFETDWTAVNAWIWGDGMNYTGGTWPGQPLTYLGNKVWKWQFTGTGKVGGSVIFNNGSQQTGSDGWAYVNGGYYNADGYVKTIEGAGPIDDPDPIDPVDLQFTAFFDNTSAAWATPYVWIWDEAHGNKNYTGGTWPGRPMTIDEVTGYYTYTCTVTDANPRMKIIFSNAGKPQTADLDFVHTGIYTTAGFTGQYVESNIDITALNLNIRASQGQLFIDSPYTVITPITVTRLDGTTFTLDVHPGTNAYPLPRGFYIIATTKIIL